MKKHVLFVGCLLFAFCGTVVAQNKTLGVGVTTPNSNAALHVESPTSNQGFIMPRLTTAQRTATGFISVLTASDNGLMVYDTDLNSLFIWDGSKWITAAQGAGTNGFNSTTTGLGSAGQFTINNSASFAHALIGQSNGDSTAAAVHGNNTGNGFGVFGKSAGSRFASAAVYGEHVGTGDAAGAFRISNSSNTYSALYGETNGSGPAVFGNQLGLGRGSQFQIQNAGNSQAALRAFTNGTGYSGFFTVNNPSNQSAAIYATTNGTVGGTAYLSAAILGETSTAFSAVTGRVGAGQSNGVSGLSASTDPGSYAILGSNSGAGPAGMFNINNASNTSTAFEASTNGTGGAGKFQVNNVNGTVPALWAETNSNQPLSAPIYGLNTGTGDVAASFRINNASSTFPALFAESNGTGRTATFRKLGTTGNNPAVYVQSMGGHGIWADHNSTAGYAAIIQTINTGNPNAGMLVESIGTGPSVWALKSTDGVSGNALEAENQLANGSAGRFEISDATNGNPTIFTLTGGTGAALQAETSTGFAAIFAQRNGSSNGNAGVFNITNAANSYPSLQSNTVGTGSAGNFQINNASSSGPSIFTQTNGTGTALSAVHTGASGDAIWAQHQGAGPASAGNFQITNGSNTGSAVTGSTQAAGGTGIGALNTNNGVALAIWQGGMKITTQDVSSTSIATRNMAYRITGGGTTFSFTFGPTAGEVFLVYNDSGTGITVEGVAIPNGEGRTLVHYGAVGFRGF